MESAAEQPSYRIIGFKDEIASIQNALAEFESGRKSDIAVISEPFAGRTTLINAIEQMTAQKITKVSLGSLIKNQKTLSIPERAETIVIVDNCQFLYVRAIGGFHILEEFLESVVSSSSLFITTWNLYSWNYLEEVRNIGKYFPIQIKLPKLSTAEIKELLLSQYDENKIEFVDDGKPEEKRIITTVRYPLTLKRFQKTFSIPFFHIDFGRLKFHLSRKEETKKAEDIIIELIYRYANGNPGVARVIWEKSLEYPTIKPSYVKECSYKIELDYSESYILFLILSMEALTKEELATITGDREIDKRLHRLAQQHLITLDHEYYKLNPEALHCIVGHLKKAGVIW
jgi:hypothetical protein